MTGHSTPLEVIFIKHLSFLSLPAPKPGDIYRSSTVQSTTYLQPNHPIHPSSSCKSPSKAARKHRLRALIEKESNIYTFAKPPLQSSELRFTPSFPYFCLSPRCDNTDEDVAPYISHRPYLAKHRLARMQHSTAALQPAYHPHS